MTLTTIERPTQAGDYGFIIQPGDRQFALKYVVILPSPSRIILECYLKLDDSFLLLP